MFSEIAFYTIEIFPFPGIHAREWITSASVSYTVNELCENRDAHSSWLDKVDLYVLPLANPDGYEYSHQSDRMWRKNRRRGECSALRPSATWR